MDFPCKGDNLTADCTSSVVIDENVQGMFVDLPYHGYKNVYIKLNMIVVSLYPVGKIPYKLCKEVVEEKAVDKMADIWEKHLVQKVVKAPVPVNVEDWGLFVSTIYTRECLELKEKYPYW